MTDDLDREWMPAAPDAPAGPGDGEDPAEDVIPDVRNDPVPDEETPA